MREVLHKHGLSGLRSCPREGCGLDETIDHVFWGCGFVKGVWGDLVNFFPKLGILSHYVLMLGLGFRGFLSLIASLPFG